MSDVTDLYNEKAIDPKRKSPQNRENRRIARNRAGKGPPMQHRGEKLVRIVSALITLGMAGCLIVFAIGKRLDGATIAAYSVAVVACAVFATPWPWRETSRSRFYALLGVLWSSAAASAWIHDQSMTATLYGVAAALSFWGSLTSASLRSDSHAGHAGHAQQAK
ncbi:MAG: hypothetical protein WAL75_03625 [Terracidiphilus sp.]